MTGSQSVAGVEVEATGREEAEAKCQKYEIEHRYRPVKSLHRTSVDSVNLTFFASPFGDQMKVRLTPLTNGAASR
jgi:hypothetical protein